ncbi:GroES-like protein [Amniculicola lignicola CBS 123094]|uniref:GroES-like protein n=1 Tax=Amniculicola lignicola CBS 123094 TaxID=1392246 RepID=A0A6A5W7U3_9PLEO|nr:GroES-like protein [Amniculicola lignicola CBS 123094]
MTTPTIPDKMIAAQVVELKRLYELVEVPAPKDLAPDDLLIKTAVASLCHTDFMVLEGLFGDTLPRTGSHEGTGTVVAIGSDVQNVMIGDRVMASIFCHPCCGCNDCLGPENFSQYCQYIGGKKGVTTHGFFAGYAAIDATQAAKLPDRVSFPTAAPLACAGCTVWRGVLQSELKAAEWLAIVGSGGGLCHIGVQFGKALGLNLIGIDARDEVIEVTKQRKADIVIDAIIGREKVVEEVKKVTNAGGSAGNACGERPGRLSWSPMRSRYPSAISSSEISGSRGL